MPLYPFVCKSCGHEWTDLRSATQPLPHCEACKSPDVQRTIGNTSFRLVGASWAASGYGKTNNGGRKK